MFPLCLVRICGWSNTSLQRTSFVLCIKRYSAKFDFLCNRTRFIKQTWQELLEWCPSRRNIQMVWWFEQSLDYFAHCLENPEWELENSMRNRKMIKFCVFNVSFFFLSSSCSFFRFHFSLVVMFSSIPVVTRDIHVLVDIVECFWWCAYFSLPTCRVLMLLLFIWI